MEISQQKYPREGLIGLRRYLRADMYAGLITFFLSIPFCLSIAFASGFPLMSGILTAVVGGLLISLVGGSSLGIKGPTTAYMPFLFLAIHQLGHGHWSTGLSYTLAVIVAAGIIQIIFGLLPIYHWLKIIPEAVTYGVLSAVGVLVIVHELHYLLGSDTGSYYFYELLLLLPQALYELDLAALSIGLVTCLVLFSSLTFQSQLAKLVPTPFMALLIGTGLAIYFDLPNDEQRQHLLAPMPQNWLSVIIMPDFSKVFQTRSLLYALVFALVGSLETITNLKAIDAIDQYRRKSNLRRELIAIGLGNVVCGLIGALPMITVMLRSINNVNSGAKTRWSGFWMGLFLALSASLLFVVYAIPKAALAAVMIYTAYRLNSPRLIGNIYRLGTEQLLLFVVTALATIFGGVLWGIGCGLLVYLMVYLFWGASLKTLFIPEAKLISYSQERNAIKIRSAAVVTIFPYLERMIKKISPTSIIYIDCARSPVVDYNFMELIYNHANNFNPKSQGIELQGLDDHLSVSSNPLATRIKPEKPSVPKKGSTGKKSILTRLYDQTIDYFKRKQVFTFTSHQADIWGVATINNAKLRTQLTYDGVQLQAFRLAAGYEIKYRENKFRKKYREVNIEFSELFLSKGMRLSEQNLKISVLSVKDLPLEVPDFLLEKESLLKQISLFQPIEQEEDEADSYLTTLSGYRLKGNDKEGIYQFFNPRLVNAIEQHPIYNLEAVNGQVAIYIAKNLMNRIELEDAVLLAETIVDSQYEQIQGLIISQEVQEP